MGIIKSPEIIKDIDLLIHSIDKNQILDEYQKDEIRDHLAEEMAQLKLKGLSEKESFLVASHRFGHIHMLIEEYGKSNSSYFNLKDLTQFSILILYGLMGFYLINILLLWIVGFIIKFSLPQYFVFVLGTAAFAGFITYFYNIYKNILHNSFRTKHIIVTLILSSLSIVGFASIPYFIPTPDYLNYMDTYRLMSNLEFIFIIALTLLLTVTYLIRNRRNDNIQEEFV